MYGHPSIDAGLSSRVLALTSGNKQQCACVSLITTVSGPSIKNNVCLEFPHGGFPDTGQDCGGSGGIYLIFKTVSSAYQILVENKNLNELVTTGKRCKKKILF